MSWVNEKVSTSHGTAHYGTRARKVGRYGEPVRKGRRQLVNRGPYVRASAVRELLQPMMDELGLPTLAALAGINARALQRMMRENRVITWIAADVLICDVLDDPSLWHTAEGLELVDQLGRPL